jgi:multiple sugar transport system substrate-binding protein
MQSGRAAMTINSLGRSQFYNDKDKSQFPGKFKATTLPIAKELADKFEVAPAKTEFWAMVIPKNAKNKKLAWSLIKEMVSKENTLKAALNGNGPVRNSTYTQPAFAQRIPYAQDEARVLRVARVPLPAFDNSAKAGDIFVEEIQSAVLGRKAPQQAMDDVVRRVQPLLP